jgi:hypothetical protein
LRRCNWNSRTRYRLGGNRNRSGRNLWRFNRRHDDWFWSYWSGWSRYGWLGFDRSRRRRGRFCWLGNRRGRCGRGRNRSGRHRRRDHGGLHARRSSGRFFGRLVRYRFLFFRSLGFGDGAKMLAHPYRGFHFNRTGVRLFLGDSGFRQIINNCLGLDLEFASQFVDSDLIRIGHCPPGLLLLFLLVRIFG